MWVAKASLGHNPLPFLISTDMIGYLKNCCKDKGIGFKLPNFFYLTVLNVDKGQFEESANIINIINFFNFTISINPINFMPYFCPTRQVD